MQFIDHPDLGVTLPGRVDVHLSLYDIVQPDITVVLKENASKFAEAGINGAPDLVVEIISPSTAGYDRVRKWAGYAVNGVREYWIVDPDTETILAQRLNGQRFVPIGSEDGSVHSVLIGGMTVDPKTVFAMPDWLPSE